MANLIPYLTNEIEALIDQETGECFLTVSGYARLSGKSKPYVHKKALLLHPAEVEVSILKVGKARLIPEAEVAAWLVKDNPALARLMAQAGTRAFLHQLAGYQGRSLPSKAQPSHIDKAPTAGELLVAMAQAFVSMEARVGAIEAKVEAAEAGAVSSSGYYTLKGYCRKLGIKAPSGYWAQDQGREATRLCSEMRLVVLDVDDPSYGTVGAYPEVVLSLMRWPLPSQYRQSESHFDPSFAP